MELYEEKAEQKKSKVPMIIGILIIILVIITILMICGIIYLKNSIITVKIDSQAISNIQELLYIEQTEEGEQLYLPINKMAKYLGYEGFKGDYKNKSEDKNKCHVINTDEAAMFTLESNILVKISEDSQYEYLNIDKPVVEKENELYTTLDGIGKAFNVSIATDENQKNINIYTMDYLLTYHASRLNITEYSDEFKDKKAILEGFIITIDNNKKYGVVNIRDKGQYVLEPKYEMISYLSATKDFLVKSNSKYGIVSNTTQTKVRTVYDEISVIDNEKGLYLVKQNNSYGIININGNIIIEPEYKQIGVNGDKYAQNGIENKYVLLDEIIPIQNSEGLWGLFNIKGEQITDFQYNGIGCESAPVSNAYPAVVIPSYDIIVVQKQKSYNLLKISGELAFEGYILDSVYLKTNTETEKNEYYMTTNNNTKVTNVEQWLENN